MIERIMTQPIFMFTRVALSALITASAGILIISFLYFAWIFVEDVYVALNKEEVVIEETSKNTLYDQQTQTRSYKTF